MEDRLGCQRQWKNYVTLFEKNKHLVYDQDKIFPHQILVLPGPHEWAYPPER